jgi:hypothetical protein
MSEATMLTRHKSPCMVGGHLMRLPHVNIPEPLHIVPIGPENDGSIAGEPIK